MKEKLFKAYTAAWKWPEVYTTSPSIIWISRAIAVLIPVGLIALTFLTGIPAFGLAKTLLVTAIIAFVIVLTTIKIFYQEYETVEDFQSREDRIHDFFHGFPLITPVPLIELESDEWVAFGHVPPKEFVEAVQQVITRVTDDPDRVPADVENQVGHLYAVFKNPQEGHWSEGIELCKPTKHDSFPITRLIL